MTWLNPEDVVSAAELASVLRAFLRARREPMPVQASAIAYETAALFAREAPSFADACDLVDWWATMMKDQIQRLGVGVEHP